MARLIYAYGLSLFLLLSCVPFAQAALYTGSLSAGSGLTATEDWDDTATELTWIVTNEDSSAPSGFPWKYTYTLHVPKKDISHFIVEVSDGEDPFTVCNLADVTGAGEYEVQRYHPTGDSGSNPLMPGDLYGVKLEDWGEKTEVAVSFFSDRQPVWGDFYAKDGTSGGEHNPVVLYNTGFSATDPADAPADGSVENHLLVPDTVPEPAVMTLLLLGGVGLLSRRIRR